MSAATTLGAHTTRATCTPRTTRSTTMSAASIRSVGPSTSALRLQSSAPGLTQLRSAVTRGAVKAGTRGGRSATLEVSAFKFLKEMGLEKPSWLPNFNKEKRAAEVDAKLEAGEAIVVGPDYSAAGAILGSGVLLNTIHIAPLGVPLSLLGAFLIFQTANVKFVFGDKDFYLKTGLGAEEELKASEENWVVGGENKWAYDSFVNWRFFPAKGGDFPFPILVYFKETQTPEDKWNEGPGQLDKKGGGQVHFFPCVVDSDEMERLFIKKECKRIEEAA